jgi:hypothetical protein
LRDLDHHAVSRLNRSPSQAGEEFGFDDFRRPFFRTEGRFPTTSRTEALPTTTAALRAATGSSYVFAHVSAGQSELSARDLQQPAQAARGVGAGRGA